MRAPFLRHACAFLDSWLAYKSRHTDIPGFSVAVYYKDDIQFARAYGVANLEHQQPLTPEHYFSAASQTKMFTATAILQLAQEGRLNLNDHATKYLPWLAAHSDNRYTHITIRHLLSHTSGMPHDSLHADYWGMKSAFPNEAGLRRIVLTRDLIARPGQLHKYSNLGFLLLGQIIEQAGGQPYKDYITKHIIKPLGLQKTVVDTAPLLGDQLATGYTLLFEQQRLPLPRCPTVGAFAPGIGVYATPADMCRFASGLLMGNESLLPDKLKQEMHPKGNAEFGLGHEVQYIGDRQLIGHSGHFSGYTSATFFDPKARLAVAVMTNAKEAPVVQMTRGIFSAFAYFMQHGGRGVNRFNTRVCGPLGTVELVATKGQTIAIDPDEWEPFESAEDLRKLSPTTFRIVTPHSTYFGRELVRYTFNQGMVKAVNYAGMHMLPEHNCSQIHASERQDLAKSDSQVFGYEDFIDIPLHIGKIVKVDAVKRGPARYRLSIDFGPRLGVKHTYLHSLPTVNEQSIIGCHVMGALYASWYFGKQLPQVLLLGIAPQKGMALLPGSLVPLVPDPLQPRVLPAKATDELVIKTVRQSPDGYFKFEALHGDESVNSMTWDSPSLRAWSQGKTNKAKALMEKEKQQPPSWIVPKNHTRIRLINDTSSAFLRWELEYFKRVVIPVAHETIYLVHTKNLQNLTLPEQDFTIFNNATVMMTGYSKQRFTHGTFYSKKTGCDIDQFLELKDKMLQIALTQGHCLGV